MKTRKAFIVLVALVVMIQSILPMVSNAESTNPVNFTVERNGDNLKVHATSSDGDIVKMQYVFGDVGATYFQESHSDIKDVSINQGTTVEATIPWQGYGTYTIAVITSKGLISAAKQTYNDPENRPDITVTQDTNNKLKLNIIAQAKVGEITEIKIAKVSSQSDTVDFKTQGNSISIVAASKVETSYTVKTEGFYKVYAKASNGSSVTTTITVSQDDSPIKETYYTSSKLNFTIEFTDSFSNINEAYVVNQKDLNFDGLSGNEKTEQIRERGTKINITSGQTVRFSYTVPASGGYYICVMDEAGYGKASYKVLDSGQTELVGIVPTQDENNKRILHINAFSYLGDINAMKYKVIKDGENPTVTDILNNGINIPITPGSQVSVDVTFNENCKIMIAVSYGNGGGYALQYNVKGISGGSETTDTNGPEIYVSQNSKNSKQIDVEASDESYVRRVKWAKGDQTADYFANNGTQIGTDQLGSSIQTSFNISETGVYTIYAEDNLGNKSIKKIQITTISGNSDQTGPGLVVNKSSAVQNKVLVEVTASDSESGVKSIKYAEGQKDASYFKNGGQELQISTAAGKAIASVNITKNGTYTFYAEDNSGNGTVKVIQVTDITEEVKDTTAPIIETTVVPANNGYVTIKVSDAESTIVAIKVAPGNKDTSYFNGNNSDIQSFNVEQGKHEITGGATFKTNGTYTVYAKNSAGLESIKTITIDFLNDNTNNNNNTNTNTNNNNTNTNTNTNNNNTNTNTNTNNNSNTNTNTNNNSNTNTNTNNNSNTNTNTNNNSNTNTNTNNNSNTNTNTNNNSNTNSNTNNNSNTNTNTNNNNTNTNTNNNSNTNTNTNNNSNTNTNTNSNSNTNANNSNTNTNNNINSSENNSIANGTNNLNNTNSSNSGNIKLNQNTDGSTSIAKLPYTGLGKTIVGVLIASLLAMAIVSYIKYKRA